MVGVPGKSKGCSTCRRRKKGCDQKRPVCGQCISSGYVCGGYQRDLTFILHPTSKTLDKAVFLPVKPGPPLLTLLPSLERPALINQCRHLFFDIFLPRGRGVVRDPEIMNCGHPLHWTEVLHEIDSEEKPLELAFSALSISRVGRGNNDTRLVKESTKLYGKALKSLQQVLFDPTQMNSDQVLLACLLLGQYELFEGVGGKSVGWVSHAQGAARLLEMRGPEVHNQNPAHWVFLGTRVPIINAAILRRKRTFLEEPEWLDLPWRARTRTGFDRLIDLSVKIPGLLEDFDNIRAQNPSGAQVNGLLALLNRCRVHQKQLSMWPQRRKPGAKPEFIPHERTERDPYPFDYEVVFQNHLFAHGGLQYWCACLVVATTTAEIEMFLATLGYQAVDMMTSTARAQQDACAAATNIAQAIPYCLLPEMGDLGINHITFPICLAFKYFLRSNDTAICSWLIQTCNDMKKTGLRLSPFEPTLPPAIPESSDFDEAPVIDLHQFKEEFDFNQPLGATAAAPLTPQSLSQSPRSREATPKHMGTATATTTATPSVVGGPDSRRNSHLTRSSSILSDHSGQQGYPRRTSADAGPDVDYDSDYDAQSPVSDGRSSDASRHGSIATTAVSRQLAQQQFINASKGEFTFVPEDPSRHYIVSESGR